MLCKRQGLVVVAASLMLVIGGIAHAQTPSPSPAIPQSVPRVGARSGVAPISPVAPVVVRKHPLRIANYGSKPVDCFIDGGLKCKLPTGYQCVLQIPTGRHSLHLVRSGSVYDDAFTLPESIAGKEYDGGAYLIKDDRIDYAPVVFAQSGPAHGATRPPTSH